MSKRIAVVLLFMGLMILFPVSFQVAKSQSTVDLTIINADGSITPSIAPIQRNGDIFTLTGDISGYLVLAKNNTILDGAGHTVLGVTGPPVIWVERSGYQVNSSANLRIMNIVANGSPAGGGGIVFVELSNSTVANNTLNGGRGISCSGNGNIVSGNNITDSCLLYGSIVVGGSDNVITGNRVKGANDTGINIGSSNNNLVVGNQIADCRAGISTINIYSQGGAYDNVIYYNNFINNTKNVNNEVVMAVPPSVSIWNNGSAGNYWSDYNGTDANHDGVGDAPYIIDENNQDPYPLMSPIDVSIALSLISPSPSPSPSPLPTPTSTPTIPPTPAPTSTSTPKPSPIPSPSPSPSPTASEPTTPLPSQNLRPTPKEQESAQNTEILYAAATISLIIVLVIIALFMLRWRKL